MRKRSLFLLTLGLLSSHAFAQDTPADPATPASPSVGYISCPARQERVFLYQSLQNFEVLASPKCDERVEVIARVDTLGGYLRVRTADGKEGYVPQAQITATAPVKPQTAVQPPPVAVPTAQVGPLSGPVSYGSSDFGYDVPQADVYGGYSYMSMDWENIASRSGFHGWNASATYNVNHWLGVEGDLGGHYQRNCAGGPGLTCAAYTLMGGPRVTAYRGSAITAFGHGLVGVGVLGMSLSGSSLTWKDLAWAVGGGADYAVTERFSVRVGQFDYLRTQYLQSLGGTHQNNFRISGGIVIRIGRLITE
jgi:opacity protein-like surface antigen